MISNTSQKLDLKFLQVQKKSLISQDINKLAVRWEPVCRHSFNKFRHTVLLTGCCWGRWCLASWWAQMRGWALSNSLNWLCVCRVFSNWQAETGHMHWQNNNQISCSNTTCRSCQRAQCLLWPCCFSAQLYFLKAVCTLQTIYSNADKGSVFLQTVFGKVFQTSCLLYFDFMPSWCGLWSSWHLSTWLRSSKNPNFVIKGLSKQDFHLTPNYRISQHQRRLQLKVESKLRWGPTNITIINFWLWQSQWKGEQVPTPLQHIWLAFYICYIHQIRWPQ